MRWNERKYKKIISCNWLKWMTIIIFCYTLWMCVCVWKNISNFVQFNHAGGTLINWTHNEPKNAAMWKVEHTKKKPVTFASLVLRTHTRLLSVYCFWPNSHSLMWQPLQISVHPESCIFEVPLNIIQTLADTLFPPSHFSLKWESLQLWQDLC